jgi:hypothetical protein
MVLRGARGLSPEEFQTFLTFLLPKFVKMLEIVQQLSPGMTGKAVTLFHGLTHAFLDPHFAAHRHTIQEAVFGLLWLGARSRSVLFKKILTHQKESQKEGVESYLPILDLLLQAKMRYLHSKNKTWIRSNSDAEVTLRHCSGFSEKIQEPEDLMDTVRMFFTQVNPKLFELLHLNLITDEQYNNVLRGVSMGILGAMYAPAYQRKAVAVVRSYAHNPDPAAEPGETIAASDFPEEQALQTIGNRILFAQFVQPVLPSLFNLYGQQQPITGKCHQENL